MIDTVIFDLDGTLLNTLDDLAASTNAALEMNELPQRTTEEVRMFVGNGVCNLMRRAIEGGESNSKFEKTFADFKVHYAAHCMDRTGAYPGIMALLASLQEEGFRLGVVSNKFDAAVKKLNLQYFGKYIPVAIGEKTEVHKKPAPDSVFAAMAELCADAESCIYVGDSDVDILTAKNAGIPCISVLWGFRDRKFLLEHGASVLVEKPEEILNVIRNMNIRER